MSTAGNTRLRLDQIDAVFRVVAAAESGALTPTQGLRRPYALLVRVNHPSAPPNASSATPS